MGENTVGLTCLYGAIVYCFVRPYPLVTESGFRRVMPFSERPQDWCRYIDGIAAPGGFHR